MTNGPLLYLNTKTPLPWGHKFYTYMTEASNSFNILIMYSISLVDADLRGRLSMNVSIQHVPTCI